VAEHAPLGASVLKVSMAEVMLPTLNTRWWHIRKSRIQLQREVFSQRVLSLVTSLEGIMVLNAEL
jgi:hypothetical protein